MYVIDLETAMLAEGEAKLGLSKLERVRAARAELDGYLSVRHAHGPLDRWWRASARFAHWPTVYAEPADDGYLSLRFDTTSLMVRWSHAGVDAVNAVLTTWDIRDAVMAPGKTELELTAPIEIVRDVVWEIARTMYENPSAYIEPLLATCTHCGAIGPAYQRSRLRLDPAPGQSDRLVWLLCRACTAVLVTSWLPDAEPGDGTADAS